MPTPKFQKGNPGRPKGAVGKTTKTVKEVFQSVFHKLQDDPKANLAAWAKDQPGEFYKISSKLIPTTLAAALEDDGKDGKSFEITLKI